MHHKPTDQSDNKRSAQGTLLKNRRIQTMMNDHRAYRIVDVNTARELAENLSTPGRTWCLCAAFRYKGLLFLNDAFSEDGAQEYAVVRESDNQQIESITFSWISIAEAKDSIEEVETGNGCPGLPVVALKTTHPVDGPCHLCA